MPRHPTLSNEQIAAVEEAMGLEQGAPAAPHSTPERAPSVSEQHDLEQRVKQEQRPVDYTLDVLMPQGPMNDERPW